VKLCVFGSVEEDCYEGSRGLFPNYLVLEASQVLIPRTVANVTNFLLAQELTHRFAS
jgi:hypothetical protein